MWWPFRRKTRPPSPAAGRPHPSSLPRGHAAPLREAPSPLPEPEPLRLDEPLAVPPQPLRTAEEILRELADEPAAGESATAEAPVDPALARHLLAEGPLTREFIHQQIALSGKADSHLCQLLAKLRAPAEAKLFRLLAAGYQVPQVDLKQCKVLISVARSIPAEIALKYKIVPIARIGDLLCVAFAGEVNPKATETVRRATGMRVKAFRCPPHHMAILLKRLFHEPAPQHTAAVPISEKEYEDALRGFEALWESTHVSRGPIRAERIA